MAGKEAPRDETPGSTPDAAASDAPSRSRAPAVQISQQLTSEAPAIVPAERAAEASKAAEERAAADRTAPGQEVPAQVAEEDRPATTGTGSATASWPREVAAGLSRMAQDRTTRMIAGGALALMLLLMLMSFLTSASYDPAAASAAAQACTPDMSDPSGLRSRGGPCVSGSTYVDSSYRALHRLPAGVNATAISFAALSFLLAVLWGRGAFRPAGDLDLRRFATGAAAVVLAALALAAVAQVIQLAAGSATAALRGTFDSVPEDFWSVLLLQSLRGVLLAGVFAAMGWALTAAVRSTTAALAVALTYVVVFEVLLAGPERWWAPAKLSHNTMGWLWPVGIDILVQQAPSAGGAQERVVHIGMMRALISFVLILGLLTAVAYARSRVTRRWAASFGASNPAAALPPVRGAGDVGGGAPAGRRPARSRR